VSEKRFDSFVIFATFLVVLVAISTIIGATAVRPTDSKSRSPGATAPGTVEVSMKELSITPATITVAAGGSLHIVNSGAIPHNFSIQGTDLKTPDLGAGESAHLELGDLEPGSYEVLCEVPGHAGGGMTGTMTIAAAGDTSATAARPVAAADHTSADMQQKMIDSMTAFPAETEGVGNQLLEPKMQDGFKVYDLTAEVTKWEVSPGKTVDAWSYNGMVPAPMIRVNVGDRVKINLHNKLEVGTDLHLHGIKMENKFDGVAPLTQPLIETGKTFTYEFTANEPAVAMYHSHFMSQIGVPNGLFGTIYVGEMPLPTGRTVAGRQLPASINVAQRFPIVLNDSGVIGYSLNGKSFPATAPISGKLGDWVVFDYFNEGTQVHPMHLHRFDKIVIAKDGFPLDSPYTVDTLNVAPGERYSVLVNLDTPGTWVWHCHILPHVEKEDGMFGMVTAVVVK
jgi:FtsP/CotA-like multicopper oxidase with cupredoxin domain